MVCTLKCKQFGSRWDEKHISNPFQSAQSGITKSHKICVISIMDTSSIAQTSPYVQGLFATHCAWTGNMASVGPYVDYLLCNWHRGVHPATQTCAHTHTLIYTLIYTHTEAGQCKETLPVFASWQLTTSLFPVNWELATSQLLILIIKTLFQLNHDIRFLCNVKNDLIQVGTSYWYMVYILNTYVHINYVKYEVYLWM